MVLATLREALGDDRPAIRRPASRGCERQRIGGRRGGSVAFPVRGGSRGPAGDPLGPRALHDGGRVAWSPRSFDSPRPTPACCRGHRRRRGGRRRGGGRRPGAPAGVRSAGAGPAAADDHGPGTAAVGRRHTPPHPPRPLGDPAIRRVALEALVRIGGQPGRSALVPLAQDPDPEVRRAAVVALGGLEEGATVPILLEAYRDPQVRSAALMGLVKRPDLRALDAYLEGLGGRTPRSGRAAAGPSPPSGTRPSHPSKRGPIDSRRRSSSNCARSTRTMPSHVGVGSSPWRRRRRGRRTTWNPPARSPAMRPGAGPVPGPGGPGLRQVPQGRRRGGRGGAGPGRHREAVRPGATGRERPVPEPGDPGGLPGDDGGDGRRPGALRAGAVGDGRGR